MENKEQLLANFLAFKNIPFGDYKTIITTPKAMEFYAKNVPIDQLQDMFISAGFEKPETINKASNVLKKIYSQLQEVSESDYTGSYKATRESKELEKILKNIKEDYLDDEDEDQDEENENDDSGGFFDVNRKGGSDLEKALSKLDKDLANGTESDTPKTLDELSGRNNKKSDSNQDGKEGQGSGKESDSNQDGKESEGDGKESDSNQDGKESQGNGKESDSDQDGKESQGNGKESDSDQDGKESQGNGKESDSDQDGKESQGGDKESDENKDNQKNQKDKEKQQKQNNSLEAEIQLCSQEIKIINEEKEMLNFISEKTQDQENRIIQIDNIIDDLEFQIANMLGAINADLVLGNDVQFPMNKLPRYVGSKVPELMAKINQETLERLDSSDYKFKHKIEDKVRRNKLITDRVMEDVTYFVFEKLKKESALKELYLTAKDIIKLTLEIDIKEDVPKKITLESSIDGDTVVIDDAIGIEILTWQINNMEKDIEIVNKEKNIKLIFETIKNELFNKFII